jgi:hypothetical protein
MVIFCGIALAQQETLSGSEKMESGGQSGWIINQFFQCMVKTEKADEKSSAFLQFFDTYFVNRIFCIRIFFPEIILHIYVPLDTLIPLLSTACH